MNEEHEERVSNLKRGVRSIYREMMEISGLLGNGDPASRRQAEVRMKNMKKFADSIDLVLEKWDMELERDEYDRKEFISSVLADIENIDTVELDKP